MTRMLYKRSPDHTLLAFGPRWLRLGITLWHHGAISLQVNGHFLQIVLGDWWKAHPEVKR